MSLNTFLSTLKITSDVSSKSIADIPIISDNAIKPATSLLLANRLYGSCETYDTSRSKPMVSPTRFILKKSPTFLLPPKKGDRKLPRRERRHSAPHATALSAIASLQLSPLSKMTKRSSTDDILSPRSARWSTKTTSLRRGDKKDSSLSCPKRSLPPSLLNPPLVTPAA